MYDTYENFKLRKIIKIHTPLFTSSLFVHSFLSTFIKYKTYLNMPLDKYIMLELHEVNNNDKK